MKRTSCIPDPEEPTCQEKAHYPVFNPRDPRHNPEASIFPWRRQESSTSSAESPPPHQANWVHNLSQRSLHRARSGLLALRAGVRRHSTVEDRLEPEVELRGFVGPVALRRQRHRHMDSSRAYTSSTQEDLEFGFEMHRMSDPPPSPISDTPRGSSIPSAAVALLHEAPENSSAHPPTSHNGRPPLVSNGSISEYERSTVPTQKHGQTPSQLSGESKANTEHPKTDNRLSHASNASSEQQILGSLSNIQEPTGPTHVAPESSLGVHREDQAREVSQPGCANLDPDLGGEVCAESDAEHLLDQDRQRESTVSPDHLSNNDVDKISQSSAECLFAFPGICQEILDQWARDRGEGTPNVAATDEQPDCNAVQEGKSYDLPPHQDFEDGACGEQHVNTHNLDSPGIPHTTHTSQNNSLAVEEAQLSMTHNFPGSVAYSECLDEGSAGSERSSAYEPMLETAHSSGAHMPLLPDPQSQNQSTGYGTFSFIPRGSLAQHHSFASQEPGDFTYQSNECGYPLYSTENSTSPEYTSTKITSRTSTSSNPWSPIDSNFYFMNPTTGQNEFFLVDGKTSSQYPGWGDQPIKLTYHTQSDGSIQIPMAGYESGQAQRVLLLPQIAQGNYGQTDFEDEFTDEEFYPGSSMPPAQPH
ncbi:unnamed protein product [Penicillium salamii]|nr:unnamed protein product [Penicillium salamii]CAG8413047.1 unnamed protein product [Penicillium salamii]